MGYQLKLGEGGQAEDMFLYLPQGFGTKMARQPRDDPNYEAEVDRVHGLVLQAVQDLYDRHKGEFGWKDRPLVIL